MPASYKHRVDGGNIINRPILGEAVKRPDLVKLGWGVNGISSNMFPYKRCKVCRHIYPSGWMVGYICYKCLKARRHEKIDWTGVVLDAFAKRGLKR